MNCSQDLCTFPFIQHFSVKFSSLSNFLLFFANHPHFWHLAAHLTELIALHFLEMFFLCTGTFGVQSQESE